MSPSPADWELPPGVTRGLWDYLHNPAIARHYDGSLAGSALLDADVRFATRWFDQPGRLIDLGCGTGRLLVPFARRGYRVLGVDLAEEMLRVASEKAVAAGVEVALLQANLVELDALCDQSFDYAACLFSTLGMIAGEEERRHMVGHVFRLLRPGGRFVLHVHNRWFNLRDARGRGWLATEALHRLLRQEATGDRVMPAHQGIAGLALHHFTRREIVHLLRHTGFVVREVRPVGLSASGFLAWPRWFAWLRAYGYLIAAERPA